LYFLVLAKFGVSGAVASESRLENVQVKVVLILTFSLKEFELID
jgi:hypothetical protein